MQQQKHRSQKHTSTTYNDRCIKLIAHDPEQEEKKEKKTTTTQEEEVEKKSKKEIFKTNKKNNRKDLKKRNIIHKTFDRCNN